jgi:hypothetical protein
LQYEAKRVPDHDKVSAAGRHHAHSIHIPPTFHAGSIDSAGVLRKLGAQQYERFMSST